MCQALRLMRGFHHGQNAQSLPSRSWPHGIVNMIQETLHVPQFRAITREGGGAGLHGFYLKTHANWASSFKTYQGSF